MTIFYLATSFLTVLEFVSAIRRLLKGNRISQDDDELMKAGKRENLEVINPRNDVDRRKLIEMLR